MMLSKLTGIAVLAFSASLLLATSAVQAAKTKIVKGTFSNKGEAVSIGSSFSFDGVTVNDASLVSYSGSASFAADPSLNESFTGQAVAEYNTDTSIPCTFIGVFGESEPAKNTDVTGTLTLVGYAFASNGSNGSTLFGLGQTATGCIDVTDGAYSLVQTDEFKGGPTGPLKNAIGTQTYTNVGLGLAPSGAAGSFGFFQWGMAKRGKITLQIPVR
jgi:hypothetical protein